MQPSVKYYAIVPAAGSSVRMGQPKLVLPWPPTNDSHRTSPATLLIDQVLQAWVDSRVHETVVVVRRGDAPLLQACRAWPVHVVSPPQDPVDMKASIQAGLRDIQQRFSPAAADRVFVAPADLPTLNAPLIDALITASTPADVVTLPFFGEKQGHPALISWSLTPEVFRLPAAAGLDSLLKRHPHRRVDFPPDLAPLDVDTPAEYEAAAARWQHDA